MCLSMAAHVQIAGQLVSKSGRYFRDGLTKYRVQEGHLNSLWWVQREDPLNIQASSRATETNTQLQIELRN